MLLTKESPLMFSPEVISNLIEQLNIYGTSVDKFRRILKLMIMEFVHSNNHYLVHQCFNNKLINVSYNKIKVEKYLEKLRKKLLEIKDPFILVETKKYTSNQVIKILMPAIEDFV